MNLITVADLCETSPFEVDFLTKELKAQGLTLDWQTFEEKDFEISLHNLKKFDISFLCGWSCVEVNNIVHRRKLDIHYMNYLDVIENINGNLWGDSLFSHSFKQVFLNLRKNRQLSGSVIFLGGSANLSPIVDTLAKLGFQDFNFLCNEEEFKHVQQISKNLVRVNLQVLDSTQLIQSSKEYSLCFVSDGQYPDSVLSDISYFHFLSQRSLVLNLVGTSNFPFQEVIALGTEVVDPDSLTDVRQTHLREKILNYAKKLSV